MWIGLCIHAEVSQSLLHLCFGQWNVAHAGTVAANVLTYLLWYVVPILLQCIVCHYALALEGYNHGQVIAVHGTTYLPVQPNVVGIGVLGNDKHQVVCLFHAGKEVALDGGFHQVVVGGNEVDVVYVQEIKTVGITSLPVAQKVQRVKVLLLAIAHGIHIERQVCLVVIHISCF